MFYIPDLLQKKGPWALVWLAGTYPKSKKLQTRYIQTANVHALCNDIIESEVPLSLRLSSLLMSGLVYIYYQQTEKLYNDSTARLKEISVTFRPNKQIRGAKMKARTEDITLKPTEDPISINLWEDMSDLTFSQIGADIIAEYFPTAQEQNISLSGRRVSTASQANLQDITLPEFEQIELQFEVENIGDYNFQYDLPPAGDINTSGIIPESPQPFELPSALDISFQDDNVPSIAEMDGPDPAVPIPEILEVPEAFVLQEEQEIAEEDHRFVDELKSKARGTTRAITMKVDRRISLDSDEIRQGIEDTDEIMIERPQQLPISSESTREAYFYLSNNLTNQLNDVWHFMAFEIGDKEEFQVPGYEETLVEDNRDDSYTFLPDVSGDYDEREVEQLRTAAQEESMELRKASIASTSQITTPFGYAEDPNQPFHQSTPLSGSSPYSSMPKSLPQRRASSIHPQQSPLYAEPQYFEPPSFGMGDPIPLPPVDPIGTELITSINQDSVKMLKFVRSKLKESPAVEFSEISEGMNKNQAAKSFFQVLVLASTGYLDCLQTTPFGEITIRPGDFVL